MVGEGVSDAYKLLCDKVIDSGWFHLFIIRIRNHEDFFRMGFLLYYVFIVDLHDVLPRYL